MNIYTIVLDKERSLKYSNRAFNELEKRSGVGVIAQISELSEGKTLSLKYIADFIWAGLLYEKVPYETIIDIIPTNRYLELTKLIIEIVTAEFGLESVETIEKKNITPLPPLSPDQ